MVIADAGNLASPALLRLSVSARMTAGIHSSILQAVRMAVVGATLRW